MIIAIIPIKFNQECPTGTYKDAEGSDPSLCIPCSMELLPRRAYFIHRRGNGAVFFSFFFWMITLCDVACFLKSFESMLYWSQLTGSTAAAGGVTESPCPYKCITDKYRMPNCYTPLEELIYTFGGPWPFSLLLSCIVVLLALLLSTLRIKLVGSGSSYNTSNSMDHHSHHHFPHLLSLSEVQNSEHLYVLLSFVKISKAVCSLGNVLHLLNFFLISRSEVLEQTKLRVMSTGCILWAPIPSVDPGIFLTHPLMPLLRLCKK